MAENDNIMKDSILFDDDSPLVCYICMEATKSLSFLIIENDEKILCGHGCCESCTQDLEDSVNPGSNFLCPECKREVVGKTKNLLVEQMASFIAENRKKKKDNLEKIHREEQERFEAECKRKEELEQQMKELEKEKQQELERMEKQLVELSNRATQQTNAIMRKKQEIEELKGIKDKEIQLQREQLEAKLNEMEENLKKSEEEQKILHDNYQDTQKQLLQKRIYIKEYNDITKDITPGNTGNSTLFETVSKYMNLMLWGPPPSEIIENITLYELQERRGSSKKSRVIKAAKNGKSNIFALKKCSYDNSKINPGSIISSISNLLYYNKDTRFKNYEEQQNIRYNELCKTFREPMILYHLKDCTYINSLNNIVKTDTLGEFYMELNYVDHDLEYKIECQGDGSSEDLIGMDIRLCLYQLLVAIDYIHSLGIVHRNICPTSILVGRGCIQLGSFGSAVAINTLRKTPIPYKQSNSKYKAPELWISNHDSISADSWRYVDIWSVGCIMCYLICRKNLFITPKSKDHMLQQIYSISECRPRNTNIKCEHYPLKTILNLNNNDEIDLLSKLLCFEPNRRISAAEALCHPYFKSINIPLSNMKYSRDCCVDDKIENFFNSLGI